MRIKEIINFEFHKDKLKKYKAVKILVSFFLIMLLFTMLSRFSDSLTIPRVTTGKATETSINHKISGEGIIKEIREENISVPENLLISSVNVQGGSSVKKGDIIFEVDMDFLNETISELEKNITDINKTYNRAQEDYNLAVTKVEKEIKTALDEMNLAKDSLDRGDETEKSVLQMEYDTKKSVYHQLLDSKEENLLSAKRMLEDANNTSERDKLNKRLVELKNLKGSGGKVVATRDGDISTINVESGQNTSSTVAYSMADKSEGYRFFTQIPKIHKKYVKPGVEVNLELSNGSDYLEGIEIESVKVSTEDNSMLDVTVRIPVGKGKLGDYGKLTIPNEENYYRVCVPLEALHVEENNYYVLIMGERDTILGTETTAERINVKILDKDDKYAAVEEGALSIWEEIILTSNKSIKGGDRVRKEDK